MSMPKMIPPTLQFAQAVRDGGILAMAALNHALAVALDGLPADHGLSDEHIRDLKRVFGNVMGDIGLDLINPAWMTFPELELSQMTWSAAVVEQAKQVGLKAAISLETASTEPFSKRSK